MDLIGIDVGQTDTDLVVLTGASPTSRAQAPRGSDGLSGVARCLADLRAQRAPLGGVGAVVVGSRFLIDCLIRVRGIAPTGVIRFGLPATRALPPMTGWPPALAQAIGPHVAMCHGGYDLNGNELAPVDRDEVSAAVDRMVESGVRSIAISSVFSPAQPSVEFLAARLASTRSPGLSISLSHEVGHLGLIGRENATVLNAALTEIAASYFAQLERCLRAEGINAPIFLSQNDGTVVDIDQATRYPIRTFDSGMTNAMRGASVLTGLKTCIVADVRTDQIGVGVLDNGFPRIRSSNTWLAGVMTNFRAPDVLVRDLTQDGQPFGDRSPSAIERSITELVAKVRPASESIPVVMVGPGAGLAPKSLAGVSDVVLPVDAQVAHAIGAASARAGGEVDRVVPKVAGTPDVHLAEARREAVDRAIAAGADPDSVQVAQVEEAPLKYMPQARRIRVKAVGDLSIDPPADGSDR